MSYLNSWHRDYAAESIKSKELNRWAKDPSFEWMLSAVECGQVAALAHQVGLAINNKLVADVAQTVMGTIEDVARGGTPRTRSYKKITDKQRQILAEALLERYGNARGVAAEVWALTEAEIDNADV
ncbi:MULTISPECIES: hypothetical protein [Xanthomonas]|uniref:hypothetical protein n=1 Tax=Xanthomonas TaxID=338 RepID=UPI001883E978|nr:MULTISPECIES: hypothetical protein [Xanthomonas]QOX05577.1 hypothetical protein IG630_23095 [Xanthomonas sp. WG16]QXF04369.1 hypothetical protein KJA71_23110 [Xanthomonas citri pv. citri]